MAYNRDAHLSLENEVNNNIIDLNARIDKVTTIVNNILNGTGAELAGVPAAALTNLEQLKLDSLEDVNTQGQTLADLDLVVIYDASHNILRKTTLSSLYTTYLNAKAIHPAGAPNQLQIKSGAGVTASPNLTFKTSNNTLEVNCTVRSRGVNIKGSVIAPVYAITEEVYNITEQDYTILADTTDKNIVVVLPKPTRCAGRLLNFKKTAAVNNLTLLCESGLIDGIDSRVISQNNSTRTLQSDGTNWWIISKSGT